MKKLYQVSMAAILDPHKRARRSLAYLERGSGAKYNESVSTWGPEFLKLFPAAKLGERMGRHTTFRIGGPADAYLEIREFSELSPLFSFAARHRIPVFMLGWGSNLLVLDGGMRGIVARLRGEFETIEFNEEANPAGGPRNAPERGKKIKEASAARPLEKNIVRAGAGVRLPTFVTACADRGLAGAEPLVGVPGTIGGALVMNAGTRDGEIGDWVQAVRCFDPEKKLDFWIPAGQIRFEYRRSSLLDHVILAAELKLKEGSKVDILARVRASQERRQKTQPIHAYNVGSIFKNPPGLFAARLIEESGLKGFRRGGVKVSELHANFFENDGHASAKDVLDLVDRVRETVRERFKTELELEMKVVGEA